MFAKVRNFAQKQNIICGVLPYKYLSAHQVNGLPLQNSRKKKEQEPAHADALGQVHLEIEDAFFVKLPLTVLN